MHRFRSWTLDPPEWRTQRNRLLPAEGGDGSTLNLDFMQNTLDPSINFSRGSSAFIVNSSGLLQWAEHNYYYNTEFSGITTGTPLANGSYNGWQKILTPEGTLVVNTDQSITITVTNTQRCAVARTASIPYTTWEMAVAVDVVNDPNATWGVFTIEDIFNEGSRTDVAFYVNGSQQLPTTLITGPCTIAWVFTKATNATITPYFGLSARTAGKAGTLRFKNPRFMYRNPLDTTFKYWVNTSTTTDYQTPRFDYDPTPSKLGTLKGLLIEPQVTNLVTFSEVCIGSGWSSSSSAVTDTVTTVANPEGRLSTSRNYAVAGGTFHGTGINYTPTVNNQVVTASCWFKANNYTKAYIADGANGQYLALFDLVTGVATVGSPSGTATSNKVSCKMEPYSNGWWRCQVTATLPSTAASVNTNYGGYPDTGTTITAYSVNYSGTGNVNDGIYVYGYQLEVSPCATSFIKTPAAIGGATRSPDVSRITDISSWFTSDRELTAIVDFIPYPRPASEFPSPVAFKDTGGAFHGYETYLQFPASTNNGYTLTLASKIAANTNTESNAATVQRNFERYRFGFAISSSSHVRSINGVTCTTITPPNALPASGVIDVCGIGQSGLNSLYFAGWLRQIKYWPSFKLQADLNAITSLEPPTPTLDFDFRSGVLPSNFTINRSSNSTFINSSGLVEWAGANIQPNTAFTGITSYAVPSGWGGFVGPDPGGGATRANFSLLASGTVKCTAGSVLAANTCRCFLSTVFTYPLGLPLTTKVTVVDKNISTNLTEFLLWTGAATSEVSYYKNGVLIGNLAVAQSYTDWNIGDEITMVVVPTAINGVIRVGLGNNNNQLINSYITFNKFIVLPGRAINTLNNYYTHDITSSGYYAPRFEYSTTNIGTIRGLLMEGQATNLCTYSGDMTQSGAGHWSVRTALITTSWTGFTAPDGTATAVKIIPDTSSSRHTLESSSTAVVSGTTYTASAFVKASGYTVASLVIAGGQTRRNFTLSGLGTVESQFGVTNTATITPVGTDGWYRITMTWTANATGGAGLWIGVPQNATTDVVTSWSGNGTSAIQAWGAQLEEGSGCSSYIPTGTSQVTRIGDGYELSNIASANYSTTAGTLLNVMTINKEPTSYNTITGFSMATDSPTFETFANGTSLFVAIRGDNLQTGGQNEQAISYTPRTLLRQVCSFNVENDQIVFNNINNTIASRSRGPTSSGNSRVPTRFIFNRAGALTTTNNHPSVILESLKYWPTSLTNIQTSILATG